ncbi:signal-induced proliferation-associated 1-like protein 1 isoform X2 [Clytia hemisphaerica]|uniref:Signal-induced proliferation-associated 1-like protein 1 n=1 Tax=Clytia hemisphaerica TaxID=252671 RepID=A0A7M5UNW9_9CNID
MSFHHFIGRSKVSNSNQDGSDGHFRRNDSLRHSTGSIKNKKMDKALPTTSNGLSDENEPPVSPSVSNLIKGFQSRIGNGTDTTDFATPGYVAESPTQHRRTNSKRKKISRSNPKKGKMSTDDARYSILQSLGISPFAGTENRTLEKSFGYFDIQSLFFKLSNATSLKSTYDEGSSYNKKFTGASAAHKYMQNEKNGENKNLRESMIDEGDDRCNELVLSCPFFRNEMAEPEENQQSGDVPSSQKQTKDIAKLISMFNRNRSFENLRHGGAFDSGYGKNRRHLESSEQSILLEEIKDGSQFFGWDEPKVNGKQIFDFEHIDRGALYYREYFHEKEHINLFGIDERYGPIGISIIREILPRMAIVGHTDNEKNKRYQYRVVLRTCDLNALRVTVLENSIPSTFKHGSASRPLPIKDILEFCFPDVQLSCLKYALTIPKIGEQLLKLDEQQLSLNFKIGLLYCKAGQSTEEQMYNNEKGGSEFMEFCSVIGDKVSLKGFTGYRAQLDNKNDSTGQHSLYTTFHGREIMFHVSTELPFTAHDRQQLLRKRHIGNDIVTVIFQEEGAEPFTASIMRSHFQHVFIIVQVENAHTENTRYSIAVSRSRDVPYFGPPIPPDKFQKNAAFREFLLAKIVNAEHAAHKSEKFTHMARRTRYEYLKDLANNQVSQQTLETSNKFAFSFTGKKKEKTHPNVSPEIWLQSGIVWSVKYDFEHDGPGTPTLLSISTKCITFIEKSTEEVVLSIPCKSVLGWRPTSHTLKIFYDVGKMAFFTMTDDDINELTYVMKRLKAVTTGCETQDLSLKRNNDGQLGFHVFYEGLVAEVEPYGLAWQAGLRKGSRLLEISGLCVGNMSHDRMILMLKRPGAVRIVVLPPALNGEPRNYKAVRTMRRYSSMTSIYSMSMSASNHLDDEEAEEECYSDEEALHSGASSDKDCVTPSTDSQNEGFRNDYTPPQNRQPRAPKVRSFSHDEAPLRKESISSTPYTSDASVEPTPPKPISKSTRLSATPAKRPPPGKVGQERFLTSRSASDFSELSSPYSSSKPKPTPTVTIRTPEKALSPVGSFDHELGELERQLTDTRKSIDAKFYKSLANSSSPFFRPSKTAGLSSPSFDEENDFQITGVLSQESSDDHAPSSNRSSIKIPSRQTSEVQSTPIHQYASSSDGHESSNRFKPLKFSQSPRTSPQSERRSFKKRNESMEQAMRNPRSSRQETSVYITPTSPTKGRSYGNAEPITFEIHAKEGHVTQVKPTEEKKSADSANSGSFSDSGILDKKMSSSREAIISDSDGPNRKGSLVKTKVREAAEIIHERSYGRNSPVPRDIVISRKTHSVDHTNAPSNEHSKLSQRFSHQHQSTTPGGAADLSKSTSIKEDEKVKEKDVFPKVNRIQHSPKLSARDSALVKAVGSAARNKQSTRDHQTPTHQSGTSKVILDDSLTDTFAKLESAFALKSPKTDAQARDSEKRKRRRNFKRRSRNFEPPSTDSSADEDSSPDARRKSNGIRIQLKNRNDDPETCSIASNKSEAEQSLEAAISDFHYSLSSMPEKNKHRNSGPFYSSDQSEETSKVPARPRPPQARYLVGRETRSKSQDFTAASRPLTGLESKSTGNVDQTKRRSEAKITLTSARPWSPPSSKRVEPSANIRQNVSNSNSMKKQSTKPKALVLSKDEHKRKEKRSKSLPNQQEEIFVVEEQIITETSIEDQLSPLPADLPRPLSREPASRYTNSLPGRSKRRRSHAQSPEHQKHLRSKSTSCIPLQVRGLDLAASGNAPVATKEDLHVMVTVMEEELEKERREKEALKRELNKSQKEKEVILEQSKQAASQLRKFTALFLDASPKEIEKAKQKYNESR